LRVVVSGGGTGGHYFPAYAVAQELLSRGHEVFFVGSRGRIEERLNDFPAEERLYLPVEGFAGRGLKGLKAPLGLLSSTLKLISAYKRWKPDGVVVFGGYASLPAGLAARLLKVLLFLQEQNAVAGNALRLLSRFAKEAFLGLPVKGLFRCREKFTGNPLRKEVIKASEKREELRPRLLKSLGLSSERKTLLVIGGSQGALWLNETMAEVARYLKGLPIQVIHVTGSSKKEKELREAYRAASVPFRTFPFYDRVWELYAVADAAVSRAGALAVSELALFGIPTLLVPFPYAVADHQYKNGLLFAERGAALLKRQEELTPQELFRTVKRLLFDKILRKSLSNDFKGLARPDAASSVAEEIEKWTE